MNYLETKILHKQHYLKDNSSEFLNRQGKL